MADSSLPREAVVLCPACFRSQILAERRIVNGLVWGSRAERTKDQGVKMSRVNCGSYVYVERTEEETLGTKIEILFKTC